MRLFDFEVQIDWLIFIGVMVPALWATAEIMMYVQRAYRERHDLCPQCGRAITTWRGRCAGCGLRLGPDDRTITIITANWRK